MKERLAKNFLKNRTAKKQHVLILFLLASTLFWFLTKLSKEYETKVVYNVNYNNLPSSKLFQNTPIDKLELYIKGTGFKLLREEIRSTKLNISLKNVISNGKYSNFLIAKTKEEEIQRQLDKNIELIGFVKDTLFFELGFNKHKKVPVEANLDFSFKSGYNLSSKVFLIPDSIEVSGPEIQVDKINSIPTSLLKLDAIVDDVYKEIGIQKQDALDKIKYSTDKIQVVAEVEKFTEDSFEIPFFISGLPPGTNITTYPNSVKVYYQVGLSNYNKIAASDFKIVCNYNVVDGDNTHYLIPKLVETPSLVSSIRIVPERIEYLIQK